MDTPDKADNQQQEKDSSRNSSSDTKLPLDSEPPIVEDEEDSPTPPHGDTLPKI